MSDIYWISVFSLNSLLSGGRRRECPCGCVPGTVLAAGGADAGMHETVPGFPCLMEEPDIGALCPGEAVQCSG